MTEMPPPPGSSPVQAPPLARSPLWMRITLVVSLALNLAVAGVMIGSAARGHWDDRREGRDGARGDGMARGDPAGVMTPYAAALEPAERRALGREVIGRMQEDGIGLRDLRASVQAVAEAVRADPFRPQDVAVELARQRTALGRVQELSHEAILTRLSAMTAAERSTFADRLEEGFRRRGGRSE